MKVTNYTLKRAWRTFIQSAIAYLMVNALYINYTDGKGSAKDAIIGLAIASVSAGVSGVMNLERVEE